MNEKDLFNQYVEKMESIDDDYFRNLSRDLLKGHNSYLRMRMKGSSFFNDEWIKKIEDCIYELGQIVNNPLEVTATEGNLTPIELAKKINYESIQHLASHSQYIKEIDEEGNVVPAKILSQFHKEELHTYENRFIATFIRRLVLFVEKRYEFIRTTVNFDTKDVLYIKNKSIVDGQEVSIETKVIVKKESEDTDAKIGKEYVERVEKMRRYVNYFYNSPFMKELKTEKDVRKPILQTNIIRKNPLYHKCYETFLFIERFNSLGVEYALDQNYQAFSEKERKSLNYILASHLLSLGSTERSRSYKRAKKTYKPRILTSIDDEIFTYGKLLQGPIEFVRVDDKYTEYLLDKANMTEVPKRPNKVEKEYFKEEIALKKNTEKHNKEVELLLRRIRGEIAKWEKYVQQLLEERKIEEAKEAQAMLEELRRQEHELLERRRAEIVAAALGDKKDNIPEKVPAKAKGSKVKEEVVEEKSDKVEESQPEPVEEVPTAEESQTEPIEEAKPEIIGEEKSEPVEEPVTEAIPEPVEETAAEVISEEPKAEEVVQEETPVESVAEESAPEAVLEEPQENKEPEKAEEIAEEPVIAEAVVEEPIEVVEEQPKEEPQPEIKEEQPVEEVQEKIVEEEKVEIEENSQEKPEILEVKEPVVEEAKKEEKTTKNLLEEEKAPRKPGFFERRAARRAEKEAQRLEEEKEKARLDEEKAKAAEEVRLAKEAEKKAAAEAKAKEEAAKKAAAEKARAEEEAAKKAAEEAKAKEEAIKKAAEEAKAKEAAAKPAKEPEAKPEPVQRQRRERDILEAIPGRFIVKTLKGYYISDREFSNLKSDAIIFKDFNKARRIKEIYGGKVIKL